MEDEGKYPNKQIGEVYLHVSNSGATFKITQTKYGAEIEIRSSAFENLDSSIKITTNNKGIKELHKLFLTATYHDFQVNENYAVAYPTGENKSTETEDSTKTT